MVNLSREAQEAMWGDPALLEYLETAEKLFVGGNKTVLWEVIDLCGHCQLVMPDWVRDAVAEITYGLRTGELATFDEAFGLRLESKATRKKKHRLAQQRNEILRLLHAHRLDGGSLNAEEAFEPIAHTLGISRRDVEAVYKAHGQFITSLPRGNPDGGFHAISSSSSARPKRYGRPIVLDNKN